MNVELAQLRNGSIILSGYEGYLSTERAVAMVEAKYGVLIDLAGFEILSNRLYIGRDCVTSYRFIPRSPKESKTVSKLEKQLNIR